MNANYVPEASLGMIRAGIEALEEVRRTGRASQENGDANIAYAVYEAMRVEAIRQSQSPCCISQQQPYGCPEQSPQFE